MIPVKQKPVYYCDVNGGIYEITYKTPAGDFTGGFKPKKSDLFTLNKVGGNPIAASPILVSEFDFDQNFSPYKPLNTDTPEQGPDNNPKE